MGYSHTEIEDAQARWDLSFPGDLIELLRENRTVAGRRPQPFTCMDSDPDVIRSRRDFPFRTFWFDVEHNAVWWPEWGERPSDEEERRICVRRILDGAPRLISLYRHRFLPNDPHEIGNPIFSVMGTDTICYGANLHDWLLRERGGYAVAPWPPIKSIRFWKDAVAFNNI